MVGLGLGCLKSLSTIIQLYWQFAAVSFTGEKKTEYPKKTTDLMQLTDKLYNIMLYWIHLSMSGIRTHNQIVCTVITGNIGNDQHDQA